MTERKPAPALSRYQVSLVSSSFSLRISFAHLLLAPLLIQRIMPTSTLAGFRLHLSGNKQDTLIVLITTTILQTHHLSRLICLTWQSGLPLQRQLENFSIIILLPPAHPSSRRRSRLFSTAPQTYLLCRRGRHTDLSSVLVLIHPTTWRSSELDVRCATEAKAERNRWEMSKCWNPHSRQPESHPIIMQLSEALFSIKCSGGRPNKVSLEIEHSVLLRKSSTLHYRVAQVSWLRVVLTTPSQIKRICCYAKIWKRFMTH